MVGRRFWYGVGRRRGDLAAVAQPAKPAPPEGSDLHAGRSDANRSTKSSSKTRPTRPKCMSDQKALLEKRYDLSDNPSNVQMSGKRKAVQQGVRVKLPSGATWDKLEQHDAGADQAAERVPDGLPAAAAREAPDGRHGVSASSRSTRSRSRKPATCKRFDVDFDLPDHFTPEFPPPMFLTSRPDLGDVSNGEVLTIKNYYRLLYGKVTPVQMEGMRLLLTPNPQQQFNQTEDRKVHEPSLGVTCLDCHVNGHTNATFHENPDTRPQADRLRIETVSLRGMFNQQIHGSKRSLRSIEDFTEFEQRTAYFDGDQVTAAKKGVFLPERSAQVAMMAQMQNMFDFPPAPKLDVFGKLIPEQGDASRSWPARRCSTARASCAECHKAPFFIDDKMHDLHLERFYTIETIAGQRNMQDGPIKTFTLRGIKDSPPYHHDGRLLTLDDTVEFFNLVLTLKLTDQEKSDLVAYLRCL